MLSPTPHNVDLSMDTFTSRPQLLICIDSIIDRGGADPVLHTRYDHDHAQELERWSRWSRSTASPSRSRDPIINTGDWGVRNSNNLPSYTKGHPSNLVTKPTDAGL